MKANSCRNCRFHKADLLRIEEIDGEERPIFKHRCTAGEERTLTVLDFACGIWQELTL